MADQMHPPPAVAAELALLGRYGELMDSSALVEFFKFPNERALRRAAAKDVFPVPVFRLGGRNGWFARTRDVAAWLIQVTPPSV
ncbi:pyocin activator PrtN family protein [Xanthomonas citri]|uniref:pyocin activator PrtN family protein n=1 Tax=Xanthomonas citri TaxID=346 RepID=UPI001CC11C9E|nr:pyocin activator PrtN family protein [Xanthomonas citri]